MKNIWIIDGPNVNLTGVREPDIYGYDNIKNSIQKLKKKHQCNLFYFQSNHEGFIIDKLQEAYKSDIDGVILNAGGYSHTSIAIRDAISINICPVIEVHISNIYNREIFRQTSILSSVCTGIITGFGLLSYELALVSIIQGNYDA